MNIEVMYDRQLDLAQAQQRVGSVHQNGVHSLVIVVAALNLNCSKEANNDQKENRQEEEEGYTNIVLGW